MSGKKQARTLVYTREVPCGNLTCWNCMHPRCPVQGAQRTTSTPSTPCQYCMVTSRLLHRSHKAQHVPGAGAYCLWAVCLHPFIDASNGSNPCGGLCTGHEGEGLRCILLCTHNRYTMAETQNSSLVPGPRLYYQHHHFQKFDIFICAHKSFNRVSVSSHSHFVAELSFFLLCFPFRSQLGVVWASREVVPLCPSM